MQRYCVSPSTYTVKIYLSTCSAQTINKNPTPVIAGAGIFITIPTMIIARAVSPSNMEMMFNFLL